MMVFCEDCKFYRWVEVPVEYDARGRAKMCDAGPDDQCPNEPPIEDSPVKPCPTCGRDIDGYEDCPHCLEIELMVAQDIADHRQWEREVLEES